MSMDRDGQAWVIGAAMARAFRHTGRAWSARIDWAGCMLRVSAGRGKRGVVRLLPPAELAASENVVAAVWLFSLAADEPMVWR